MMRAAEPPLTSGRWSHESEVHGVTEWAANRDFSKARTCTICGGHYYPERVAHEDTWIGGLNLPLWYHGITLAAVALALMTDRPWSYLVLLLAGGPLYIFLLRRWHHLREIKDEFGIHRDFFEDPAAPTPGTRTEVRT